MIEDEEGNSELNLIRLHETQWRGTISFDAKAGERFVSSAGYCTAELTTDDEVFNSIVLLKSPGRNRDYCKWGWHYR